MKAKLRRTAPPKRLVALALIALGCWAAIGGQSQMGGPTSPASPRLVCPLTDEQTKNAIDAFAKLVPVFHHKRCANCHGGVTPFSNPTNHAGGTQTRADMIAGGCNECHDNLLQNKDGTNENGTKAEWMLPDLRSHTFVGKDGKSLCEMMKSAFFDKDPFLGHLKKDNGGTQFVLIAFGGTRALNDEGQGYVDKYQAEPIDIMSHDEFVRDAGAWVDAMGGKFQGDNRCGCEPVHFAVRVFYRAMINLAPLLEQATMGPVDVPITFHEGGTYEGTGTLPFAGIGTVSPGALPFAGMGTGSSCSDQSQGSMQIKISGNVVEKDSEEKMHIELTNVSRDTGTTSIACPGKSFSGPLNGGDRATFQFDLKGKDGEFSEIPVPLGLAGDARLRIQVVDLD